MVGGNVFCKRGRRTESVNCSLSELLDRLLSMSLTFWYWTGAASWTLPLRGRGWSGKELYKFVPAIRCPTFLHGPFHRRIASLDLRLDFGTGLASEPVNKNKRRRYCDLIRSRHRAIESRDKSIWDVISDRKVAPHL
jgi:hypothetical protein